MDNGQPWNQAPPTYQNPSGYHQNHQYDRNRYEKKGWVGKKWLDWNEYHELVALRDKARQEEKEKKRMAAQLQMVESCKEMMKDFANQFTNTIEKSKKSKKRPIDGDESEEDEQPVRRKPRTNDNTNQDAGWKRMVETLEKLNQNQTRMLESLSNKISKLQTQHEHPPRSPPHLVYSPHHYHHDSPYNDEEYSARQEETPTLVIDDDEYDAHQQANREKKEKLDKLIKKITIEVGNKKGWKDILRDMCEEQGLQFDPKDTKANNIKRVAMAILA